MNTPIVLDPINSTGTDSKTGSTNQISVNAVKFCSYLLLTCLCVAIGITFVVAFVYTYDDFGTHEFLYINDIHVDPTYDPRSDLTQDPEGYCRRPFNGTTKEYKFGQYECDTPNVTVLSALDYAKAVSRNTKFVLFGGDTVAHELGLNRSGLQDQIRWIVDNIKQRFPGIPVLMTLGNNDFEINYGTVETELDDFYSVSEVLAEFMDETQLKTFRAGGYYYYDVPGSKLRLLLLNTVLYTSKRQYNESDPDPRGQFAWIRKVYNEAVSTGKKVAIAMHIPPGISYIDLSQGWPTQYINTFHQLLQEMTIQFILSAHTHYDMFMPIWGAANGFTDYTLLSLSITPQHGNNPGFRIMKYKKDQLTNYHQYYANLLLNPKDHLTWRLEYTFKNAYSVEQISLKNLFNIVQWIRQLPSLQWQYTERFGGRALSEEGKFYYCILEGTTKQEVLRCIQPLAAPRHKLFD